MNLKNTSLWRPIVLISAVVIILTLSIVCNVGQKLTELRSWIESLGPIGYAAFFSIYVAATIFAIPGTALTILAGTLFGSVNGTIIVSISSTVGAALAFLIGRYFARDAVVAWLQKNEKFQKLDRLTEQHGAAMVAITRLIPLFPFNLLNYGFSLTKVSFWTYVFVSWACMLPGTALYVIGTDAVAHAITTGRLPWNLLFAFFGTFILLLIAARYVPKIVLKKKG